jgi:hypothetical protein
MNCDYGVLLYTNNKISEAILGACLKQLWLQIKPEQLMVVSHKPVSQTLLQGASNILYKPTGHWNYDIYCQIKMGLEAMDNDVVFFCEHDVLYPHDHYDTCLKNMNSALVNYAHNIILINALGYWTYRPSVFQSGCFGRREVLLDATNLKLSQIPSDHSAAPPTFDMGVNEGIPIHEFWNDHELLDIRHGSNATPTGTMDKGQPLYYLSPYWGDCQTMIKRLDLQETHGIYFSQERT